MMLNAFLLLCLIAPAFSFFGFGASKTVTLPSGSEAKSIFDFTVDDIKSKPISLSKFKGKKAYIVVNVASK